MNLIVIKKQSKKFAHRQYRVDASVPLNDLNKELAVNFPEERFQYLGWVYAPPASGQS